MKDVKTKTDEASNRFTIISTIIMSGFLISLEVEDAEKLVRR